MCTIFKTLLFTTVTFGSTLLHAGMLDKSSLKLQFEGYKTTEMVGVSGVFKDIHYTFGNDISSSLSVLKNAKALIDVKSVDMGDDLITKNVLNAFFATLNKKKAIEVQITDIMEGDSKGVINVKITSQNESTVVPLLYTIVDNKFQATGKLNLLAFMNAKNALQALSKAAPGHGNVSWPIVSIILEGDLKN